jgi:hypothetical protein
MGGLIRVQLFAYGLALLCITIAYAEERPDYVLLSNDSYAAFQCAVLAAQAQHDPAEEKRLFSYALKKAKLFIEAERAGRISPDDFGSIKLAWVMVLQNWDYLGKARPPLDTSTDFVAGQVYQKIWDETAENLRKRRSDDKRTYPSNPIWSDFSSHNCSLLGRGR